MKNFWILLCFTLPGACQLRAQDTLTLYQVYHSFSDAEKTEWTAFVNNWNYADYKLLQQQQGILRLNCKTCTNFYADVFVEIDSAGRLAKATALRVLRCGLRLSEPADLKAFEASVRGKKFRVLKNKHFVVRLGQALGC